MVGFLLPKRRDRLRKSPKERQNQYVQAQRITTAEASIAVKAQPAMTFSARMPAYIYTSLCPDPKLREAPDKRKKVDCETKR
jgi:hypothetical protein